MTWPVNSDAGPGKKLKEQEFFLHNDIGTPHPSIARFKSTGELISCCFVIPVLGQMILVARAVKSTSVSSGIGVPVILASERGSTICLRYTQFFASLSLIKD